MMEEYLGWYMFSGIYGLELFTYEPTLTWSLEIYLNLEPYEVILTIEFTIEKAETYLSYPYSFCYTRDIDNFVGRILRLLFNSQ